MITNILFYKIYIKYKEQNNIKKFVFSFVEAKSQ